MVGLFKDNSAHTHAKDLGHIALHHIIKTSNERKLLLKINAQSYIQSSQKIQKLPGTLNVVWGFFFSLIGQLFVIVRHTSRVK